MPHGHLSLCLAKLSIFVSMLFSFLPSVRNTGWYSFLLFFSTDFKKALKFYAALVMTFFSIESPLKNFPLGIRLPKI